MRPRLLAVLALTACGGGPAAVTVPPDARPADGPACSPGLDCDVSLPPPAQGFQLRIGPFDVPAGTEALRCFWRKVLDDVDVVRIELAYNRGSHHIDLYTTPYAMPDGDFDCSQPAEWGNWPSQVVRGLPETATPPRMVVGFQNESLVWQLPDGVGYRLKKGQQLLVQSHFANARSQLTPTARGYALVNLHSAATPVAQQAETLFDEDTELKLVPLEPYERVRFCEFPQPVNLIGMFGHFHSRGRRFRVFEWDPLTRTQGRQLYENQQWDDPPWYTSATWGGAPVVRAIRIEADYENTEDREITWGYYVNQNEHCETYAMYYPKLDLLAGCACYHDGEQPEYIAHGHPERCAPR